MAVGRRCMGYRSPCYADWPTPPHRPPLFAGGERIGLAARRRDFSGRLAGHDRSNDGAVERANSHATRQGGARCGSRRASSTASSRGVLCWLRRRLDGVWIARLFGRHPDTPDGRCVAVACGAQFFDWRNDIRCSRPIPIQPVEGYLSCPLSAPTHGLHRRPSSQCCSRVASWYAARRRLYWLLLGADACDVRHRRGKSRLDGGPDRRYALRSNYAQ